MIENNDVGYRIRKLTPKECWRLMGFSDEAFDKAKKAKISNTQLYKQAGNSIVTDVLYYIFKATPHKCQNQHYTVDAKYNTVDNPLISVRKAH